MFEPNTFWEKRTALVEDMFAHMCETIGLTGLVSQHHAQIEVLKLAHATRLLGPVVKTEESATFFRAGELLVDRLKNIGLVYREPEEGDDENTLVLTRKNVLMRVNSLPSLDGSMGPDIVTGIYSVEMQDGTIFPALVIKKAMQVYIFSVGEDGIYPVTVSLKNMPEGFDWTSEDKQAWRSELFRYREDLTFAALTDRLDNALVALDFTEVDAQYVLWTEQMEKAKLEAAEQALATAAMIQNDGEIAAQQILSEAANDDGALRGETSVIVHIDEGHSFESDIDVTVDESGLEREEVQDDDVEVEEGDMDESETTKNIES